MNRSVFVLFTVCLVAAAGVSQTTSVGWERGTEHNKCEDLKVTSMEYQVARAEQQITIPAGQPVTLTGSKNGGIYVSGWDQPNYSILACKFGFGETSADAQQMTSQINVVANAGQVTTTGPDDKHWMVHYIVRIPRNADLTASTYNGPVSVHDADGRVNLKTHNGPLTFKNFTGTAEGETQNGPITLKGSQGSYNVSTVNGPLSLELERAQFQGELTATTRNGPVSLHVPEDFNTAFLVQGGFGPISCNSPVCKQANIVRERGNKQIEFGKSPKIKASTQNGPVSVSPRGDEL